MKAYYTIKRYTQLFDMQLTIWVCYKMVGIGKWFFSISEIKWHMRLSHMQLIDMVCTRTERLLYKFSFRYHIRHSLEYRHKDCVRDTQAFMQTTCQLLTCWLRVDFNRSSSVKRSNKEKTCSRHSWMLDISEWRTGCLLVCSVMPQILFVDMWLNDLYWWRF